MCAADAIVKVTRKSTWEIGSYKTDVSSGPRARACTRLIWSFWVFLAGSGRIGGGVIRGGGCGRGSAGRIRLIPALRRRVMAVLRASAASSTGDSSCGTQRVDLGTQLLLMDVTGRWLAKGRLLEDVAGMARLHAPKLDEEAAWDGRLEDSLLGWLTHRSLPACARRMNLFGE